MRLFDSVELLGESEEGKVARVGTGGRWGEVYKKLELHGKNVIGGRDERVGVGGLMLGGKSPHSPFPSKTKNTKKRSIPEPDAY
jgi:hypothetical protein